MVRLGLALVVLVAACSEGSGGEPEPTISDQTPTTVVETTATLIPGKQPSSDRQAAPDFTLQLGDGGSYTLSEGAKPVYLVFWAEW